MERKSDLTFDEYHAKLRWKNGRKFKITNSYRSRDYIKHYNKIKPSDPIYNLNQDQYSKVFSSVCRGMANEYVQYGILKFPYRMGELVLYKVPFKATMKDGKLLVNSPIDWRATAKLWFEDKEAATNYTFVRYNQKYTFKTIFKRTFAKFANRIFYNFTLVRAVQKEISDLAKSGQLEGFKQF